ncbi:hypothetical protein N657DRAFT_365138 [Parathielavia appendiculata]|uniref:Uncharacterized protein n=1 Tax=Parathielavia appendiculata TaxID=2587402 RepID=A0AAN6U2Z4_9PEZI|nr:hypothetical protein N657DRAFT_365138 [Parathielavia appendiculata]
MNETLGCGQLHWVCITRVGKVDWDPDVFSTIYRIRNTTSFALSVACFSASPVPESRTISSRTCRPAKLLWHRRSDWHCSRNHDAVQAQNVADAPASGVAFTSPSNRASGSSSPTTAYFAVVPTRFRNTVLRSTGRETIGLAVQAVHRKHSWLQSRATWTPQVFAQQLSSDLSEGPYRTGGRTISIGNEARRSIPKAPLLDYTAVLAASRYWSRRSS